MGRYQAIWHEECQRRQREESEAPIPTPAQPLVSLQAISIQRPKAPNSCRESQCVCYLCPKFR